jgi:prevent-host-death family protein
MAGGYLSMATRIVTVSELKTRLGALMAELEEQGVPLYVTQHGKPKAVLARYDEYEALLKKLEDFEDLLAMKESLAAPEQEAMSLDDYERTRSDRVPG